MTDCFHELTDSQCGSPPGQSIEKILDDNRKPHRRTGWHSLRTICNAILWINRTGAQLADKLSISLKTVNNHKYNIAQKLGVSGGTGCLTRFALLNRADILASPD